MKSILTKIHVLSFLCALPALANDVGLHNSSAQPTRAATTAQSNWIGDDKDTIKYIEKYIDQAAKGHGLSPQIYEYQNQGPMGMPRIIVNYSVDYFNPKAYKQHHLELPKSGISFAGATCTLLDIEAKQAGAWGPECKISKWLKHPAGNLEQMTESRAREIGYYKQGDVYREDDYWYTSPKVGMDSAHFILENGAGKKVEVILKISSSRAGGSLELGTSDQPV